jgi:predicted metal-dependent enzyme (double-stranded beta helix superfamily)
VTNHVLIRNKFIKVVLIHWKPGTESSLHGHPGGGCVFKVLHGQLREKRYVPATEKLMKVNKFQQGNTAYIDDKRAYHIVGNPFQSSAISIHAYLRPIY